jgi:hypothetical protein
MHLVISYSYTVSQLPQKTRAGGSGVIKTIESIVQPSSVVGLEVAGANTLFS